MVSNIVQIYSDIFKESSSKNKTFTIKKAKLISELNETLDLLANDVIPPLEDLILLIKEKKVTDKELNTVATLKFLINCESAYKNNPIKFISDLRDTLSNLVEKQSEMEKCFDKTFKTPVVADRSMTIGEICAVDLVKAINLVTTFTSDLLLIIAFDIRGGSTLNKKFLAKVNAGIVPYIAVVQSLKPKALEERLKLIPTSPRDKIGDALSTILDDGIELSEIDSSNEVSVGAAKSILSNVKNLSNLISTGSIGRSGFIYNPIYHLRMAWADFQASRYENLKTNKQTTEAILLDLRLKKEGGTNDPTIDKQIKYYEDKLTNIQYNIAQYENELRQ